VAIEAPKPMISGLLLASVAALGTGPIIANASRGRPELLAYLDGFVLITVGGLVMLDVVPGAISHRDLWAALLMLIGFTLPTLAERLFRFGMRRTHSVVLSLALFGIAVHSALDGSALAQAVAGPSDLVGFGVLVHQLPVSLMVWFVLSDRPRVWTWLVLTFMAGATLVGYFLEPTVLALFPGRANLWFEALIGGSLLHVLSHPAHVALPTGATVHTHEHGHDHGHDHSHVDGHAQIHDHPQGFTHWPSGLGALTGLGALAALYKTRGGGSGIELVWSAWETFRALAVESAPAIFIAYVAAGLVSAFVSPANVAWLSRGSRLRQGLSGMLLGLPLPICSCGVVPLYQGLVKQGASTTAAIAFLVATPELGLDAVLLSVPLLGGEFTILRVVAVAITALAVALLMGRFAPANPNARRLPQSIRTATVPERLTQAVRTGFGEMVDHTAPWILLGLIVAALAAPALQNSWITRLDPGVDVLIFALLGLPLYVCASASTPLVAVLVAAGVSPGAGLALLITGPATNVATLGILTRMHGRAFAVGFSSVMTVTAVLLGLGMNMLLPTSYLANSIVAANAAPTLIQLLTLIGLAALFSASLLRRGVRGFLGELRFGRAG